MSLSAGTSRTDNGAPVADELGNGCGAEPAAVGIVGTGRVGGGVTIVGVGMGRNAGTLVLGIGSSGGTVGAGLVTNVGAGVPAGGAKGPGAGGSAAARAPPSASHADAFRVRSHPPHAINRRGREK